MSELSQALFDISPRLYTYAMGDAVSELSLDSSFASSPSIKRAGRGTVFSEHRKAMRTCTLAQFDSERKLKTNLFMFGGSIACLTVLKLRGQEPDKILSCLKDKTAADFGAVIKRASFEETDNANGLVSIRMFDTAKRAPAFGYTQPLLQLFSNSKGLSTNHSSVIEAGAELFNFALIDLGEEASFFEAT